MGCERFLCGTRAVPYKEDVERLADIQSDRQKGAERRVGRSWGEQMAEKDLE